MKTLKFLIPIILLCGCNSNDENTETKKNPEDPRLVDFKNKIDSTFNYSSKSLNKTPDSSIIWADSCITLCKALDSLKITKDEKYLTNRTNAAKYNKAIALISLKKKKEGIKILEEINNALPDSTSTKICDYYFDKRDWKKSIYYCNKYSCKECVYKVAYSTYKKDGKQKAIEYLKGKIQTTSEEKAIKYYDKINPVYKVREFSHSECCDGSTSYSRGRGTCSHHGGVCSEVFETIEKRKY